MNEVPDRRDDPGPAGGRPQGHTTDSDAWAKACAEDLAAERARRRAQAGQVGSAAEELRRLAEAIAERVQQLRGPASVPAQALIAQAQSLLDQARERNPDLFDHLAAAGTELLAAYRAAVSGHEQRWSNEGPSGPEHIDLD